MSITSSIGTQCSAIARLEHHINTQKIYAICSLVDNTVAKQGRIAFCGIGKSHHVAQVTADMFASLGIPAIALNGASITHGDSGYISREDLVIFLTKSGRTDELIAASACLKNTSQPYQIAITQCGTAESNMPNLLGFDFGEPIELNGYSPTTSTLVFIAITNAIAMQCQAFTKAEFIKHHPGGAIGQQNSARG